MTDCPCCSNSMVRHIQHQNVHWFCRSCWQTMPVYNLKGNGSLVSASLVKTHFKKQLSALELL